MAYILIVEDEKDVAWITKEALKELGHRVFDEVTTASEATLTASIIRPDLVLMDIQIEGEVNGIEAAEEIYRLHDIPVVYLTAYADEQTLAQATRTYPFGYVVKPFHIQQLHTTIQIALQRHQREQALKQQQAGLSDMLTSMGDAAIATDRRGVVTFMNPMAERMTGWRKKDALGQDINQVIPLIYALNREPVENPGLQVMRLGYALNLPDGCLLRTKDGTERVISDSAAPIKNRDGEIVGSIMIFQDKTDCQNVQPQLLRQIQDLTSFQWSFVSKLQVKTAVHEQAIACIEVLNRIIAQSRTATSEGEILNITLGELGTILDADYCWAALHNEKFAASEIVSEYINLDRQNVYSSALGTEVDLELYPNFYGYLFKKESWINPDTDVIPTPYRFPCSAAQQRLICPIEVVPKKSSLTEAQVVGEVGIITTGKPLWTVAQVKLISRIVSYGVQLFRQPDYSEQDVANATERLTRLRNDFRSSVSEELLNPLLNIKQATETLRRLLQIQKENPTQTDATQEQYINQYFETFQEEWQKEFDFVHDLLNFKFLYEVPDKDI